MGGVCLFFVGMENVRYGDIVLFLVEGLVWEGWYYWVAGVLSISVR